MVDFDQKLSSLDLKHCMYFPSLLCISRWVYLKSLKRPFIHNQLVMSSSHSLQAYDSLKNKSVLLFEKKSDITSFIIRSHGQDFVSSRLIAKSASELFLHRHIKQTKVSNFLVRTRLAAWAIWSTVCSSSLGLQAAATPITELRLDVEFRCFIEGIILVNCFRSRTGGEISKGALLWLLIVEG